MRSDAWSERTVAIALRSLRPDVLFLPMPCSHYIRTSSSCSCLPLVTSDVILLQLTCSRNIRCHLSCSYLALVTSGRTFFAHLCSASCFKTQLLHVLAIALHSLHRNVIFLQSPCSRHIRTSFCCNHLALFTSDVIHSLAHRCPASCFKTQLLPDTQAIRLRWLHRDVILLQLPCLRYITTSFFCNHLALVTLDVIFLQLPCSRNNGSDNTDSQVVLGVANVHEDAVLL